MMPKTLRHVVPALAMILVGGGPVFAFDNRIEVRDIKSIIRNNPLRPAVRPPLSLSSSAPAAARLVSW